MALRLLPSALLPLTLAAMTASAQPREKEPGPHWQVAMQWQPHRPAFNSLAPVQDAKPWQLHDALLQQGQNESQVMIEFRPRSAGAELRDWGALRMQLSSSGSLAVRPRRGGVHLAWRASF
jgi:hypothetical protein